MPDYFTLAEVRALPKMSDAVVYTDARIEAAAAYIVGVIERVVGTSFVARSVTETHDGGVVGIVLDHPFTPSPLAATATVNGVAVTDYLAIRNGILYRQPSGIGTAPVRWEYAPGGVVVTFDSGYSSTPPGDIKEAALIATRARLLSSNSNADINDRRTSINTEMGTVNFTVAGEKNPTGYPEVDAVILGWKSRLNNFGFA